MITDSFIYINNFNKPTVTIIRNKNWVQYLYTKYKHDVCAIYSLPESVSQWKQLQYATVINRGLILVLKEKWKSLHKKMRKQPNINTNEISEEFKSCQTKHTY
jgi:hypothetical protein